MPLDLPQKYLEQVRALLHAHVPHAEVWAYGSRVSGGGHEASDLDLVLRNPQNLLEETAALYDLKEAFTESNLPIRVDVMDWAHIGSSSTMKRITSRCHPNLIFTNIASWRNSYAHCQWKSKGMSCCP